VLWANYDVRQVHLGFKRLDLRELYEQVAELSRVQTQAITKMESALIALKEVISQLKPDSKMKIHLEEK
jgi:hypothetical protein